MEKAEVTLGFRGEFDDVNAQPVVNQITKIVKNLNGNINGDGLKTEVTPDTLYIHFSLIGSNKVDVAYKLEQMVRMKDKKKQICFIQSLRIFIDIAFSFIINLMKEREIKLLKLF